MSFHFLWFPIVKRILVFMFLSILTSVLIDYLFSSQMPREVSGVRSLALGTADHYQLYIGTVDNNIWCTSLNAGSESPLVGAGAKLFKIMEVSEPSQECVVVICNV